MCREALGISVFVKLCTALISYRVGLSVVLADGDNGVFILQSRVAQIMALPLILSLWAMPQFFHQ
jgi:hypothetical protein